MFQEIVRQNKSVFCVGQCFFLRGKKIEKHQKLNFTAYCFPGD